jgi:hypothetical protein
VVETLCRTRGFGKWRGDGRSVRSKFGWRREARKDVAGSKTVAPSAPTLLGIPMTRLSGGSVNTNLGRNFAHRGP